MTGPFHQKPFEERMASMGDEAEGEFEARYDNVARFGFNRPPFSIQNLPLHIRYAPDFIQAAPQQFVETVGMGKNGLKFKLEKLIALSWWDQTLPVVIWVWSTPRQAYTELYLSELQRLIERQEVPVGYFREGKAYFQIRPSLLPWGD